MILTLPKQFQSSTDLPLSRSNFHGPEGGRVRLYKVELVRVMIHGCQLFFSSSVPINAVDSIAFYGLSP